jgi:hypothetical protein
VAWEPEVKASHLFEINEHEMPAHMETSTQVLVASVPLLGVQPLLCRKQQDHTLEKIPVDKENEKMVERYRCKVEHFLKEQEGFLFVFRFLFGLLMLLGPGFIVPIIFTLRQMRHFHGHCHNEECPSEMLSNLT